LIATGSSPRVALPGFEFDEQTVLSSDHVLELDRVPTGRGRRRWRDDARSRLFVDVGAEVTILEALPRY
jgi:dihydrolipoamide dehydrogenase